MKGLLIAIWFVTTIPAFAGNPAAPSYNKLSSDINDQGGDVIVQFSTAPSSKHFSKVAALGGSLKQQHNFIKAATFTLPPGAAKKLAEDPDADVAFISPDRPVKPHATSQGHATYAPYDYAVNAPAVWANFGINGTGIGVAIIDSGISNHPDLNNSGGAQRVVYQQDFVGGGTDDHYGHGEHVAGLVGGNGASSICSTCFETFGGIAPNVNLINLRVLDQNGVGTDSAVISAIQMAIQLKSQYNIRVINLSLGRPVWDSYTQDPLCQAVEAAWKAGIVVVVAAGNYGRNNSAGNQGYGTITSPGNDPYVITVGAMKDMGTDTRTDDLIASYSSKGPTLFDHVVKPDIVAPGNQMVGLQSNNGSLPHSYPQNVPLLTSYMTTGSGASSNEYFLLSGTSMAAPMVSGAAALLLQQHPNLTPDQVKARLMKTAYKSFPLYSTATDPATGITYTSQYDIFTVGAGYLDIAAALASTDVATGTAHSPTAVFNSSTGQASLVFDQSVAWGMSIAWGTSVVWGNQVLLSGTFVCWGNSVAWGASTTQGFSVIWGADWTAADSLLWGSSIAWGANTDAAEAAGIVINGE